MASAKEIGIKTGKILGFIILGIIALLIIAVLLIRLPGVQNKIVGEVEKFLQDTLQTEVNIDKAYVGFPNSIEIEGVYLEDQQGDTLLYLGSASISTDLWGLLESQLDLNNIEVDTLVARVVKAEKDSTFNFTFIMDAFAPDPAAEEDTTASAMEIRLGDIGLTVFDITYEERKSQLKASLSWEELLVELNDLDPVGTEFDIENIQLAGANIRYDEGNVAEDTTRSAVSAEEPADPLQYVVQLGELGITDSEIILISQALNADAVIRTFGLEETQINLAESTAKLGMLTLQNSDIDVEMPATESAGSTPAASPAADDGPASATPAWSVQLNEMVLESNNIAYTVAGTEELPGFDPNHLNIRDLSVRIADVAYDGTVAEANISGFTFKEGDNFTLFDTGAEFYMNDTTLRVDALDIHTRESHIRGNASLNFAFLEQLGSAETTVDVDVNDSYIHPSELLYFDPHALDSIPIRKPFDFPLSFEMKVQGKVADLYLTTLEVGLLSDTRLALTGNVKGLPDAENISFNFNKISFQSSRQNVTRLLADSLIPESIRIPDDFELLANASGKPDDLNANAVFSSSYGDFKLNAAYDATDSLNPAYDVSVTTAGFNLGTFIRDTANFQQLALDLSVEGTGIEPDSIEARIDGEIVEVDYQNYVYNNIQIDGELSSTLFNGTISIDDKNLQFTFKGDVDYGSQEMSYKIDLDLDYADLEALNFSNTPLVLTAKIDSDIQTVDFTKFTGDFAVREFSANNGIGVYRVDSLIFASIEQEGETDITIDSDMMEGYFRGDIDIASLPAVLSQHIDRYYDLQDYDPLKADSVQQFEFYLDLKKTDLLTEILVPGLASIDPGVLEGSFDSEEHELSVTFSINEMVYNDITIDSLFVVLESDPDEFLTNINLNKLSTSNAIIHGFDFDGSLQDNVYSIRLAVPDSVGTPAYLVKGNFQSLDDASYRFEIEPDTMLLAFDKWVANEGNYILFREVGFSAHNFELNSGEQSVRVEGTVGQDSLARIIIENFSLGGLASAVKKEDEILAGTLDGNIALTLLQDAYDIDADLTIAGLGYLGQQWGDLSVEASNERSSAYDIHVALNGPSEFSIQGTYDTDSAATSPLDFQVDLERLSLSLLDPIAGESVRDLEGTLAGGLTIVGSTTDPDINGELQFTEMTFTPGMLNSTLMVDDETLTFNNSTLAFDDFQLTDANDNTASIDGTVTIENTSFYLFDLSMIAENFQALNTTAEDNEMYYGNLRINADASITGTSARPTVNLDLEVMGNSALTYVLIESQEQVLNQPNVVKFIDPGDTLQLSQNPDEMDSLSYAFQGMELTANIELHENAVLNMVIDPITQDQLTVQGNANLSVEMNRTGDLQLTGQYTVTEGAYQLSFYQVVKRNFTITEGSTITWTGDPLAAELDLRAVTVVEAQPIDLVANQISSTNTNEMNRYRQRLPFEVELNIEGNLAQPEISFGLDMPEENQNALEGSVYAKIQEINSRESDLNKQVFALLVLKRFVAENPLASAGGTSLEDNARRSVSRMLSDQLNKLSDKVGGVQLDVNVESYEDYSSGEVEDRTDLELGVSKSLFDERLTVKVAGNVALEGNSQRQDDVSDYIGDLLLEYKLTEDGRLRLLGFRRNEFDVVNGEIIETGTGIIYVRDYDTFKELFNLNENEDK